MVYVVKNALKPYGELIQFSPGGDSNAVTRKTMCCQHCGTQVLLPANGEIADVGDLCRNCFEFICPRCVKRGTCNPLEKYLEACEEAGVPLNPYRLPE